MTYQEFKEECYRVRDMRQDRENILIELLNLEEHKFEKVGPEIIDTSRDYFKRNNLPDDKMIEALSSYEEKRENLIRKLESQPEINEELEDLLMDAQGIPGIIIFHFILQNQPMRVIAKGLNYSPKHCYYLMNRKLKDLYNQYCEV